MVHKFLEGVFVGYEVHNWLKHNHGTLHRVLFNRRGALVFYTPR